MATSYRPSHSAWASRPTSLMPLQLALRGIWDSATAAALAGALVCYILLPPLARGLTGVQPLAIFGPICANEASGEARDTVSPIASYPLPNVPGKRVTILKVTYPPGGFTRPHRHAGTVTAFVTKGAIRSKLDDGPTQVFAPGESFVESPGTLHLVSQNASATEAAELIAVFVADEGATLTTFLD